MGNSDNPAFNRYNRQVNLERDMFTSIDEMQKRLIENPNVVGYGIGYKKIGNKFTDDICPIFFVNKKLPKEKIESNFILPTFLKFEDKEFKTDVVVLTDFYKLNQYGNPKANKQRYRPVEMGVSIRSVRSDSNDTENSGTAGALVRDNKGDLYILSAGHVMCNATNDLVQPEEGLNRNYLTNTPNDYVGKVTNILGGTFDNFDIDAAIAKVDNASPNIVSIGIPNMPLPPIMSLNVQKSGSTTGLTFNSIAYKNVTTFNSFTSNIDSARKQISGTGLFFIPNSSMIFPNDLNHFPAFGMPGDSGALIVAGWPNNTDNFGQLVDVMIQNMSSSEEREFIPQLKNSLNKAALGLLVGVTDTYLKKYSPSSPVHSFAQSYVIGQEIQPTLEKLNVELVTSI